MIFQEIREDLNMQSHCLRHQERPATNRCASCLKPLCGECCQSYAEGIFCGEACHQSILDGQVRASKMAQMEKEMKEWRQKQFAIKVSSFCVLVGIAYFGWDYFPESVTGFIENTWASIKGLYATKKS